VHHSSSSWFRTNNQLPLLGSGSNKCDKTSRLLLTKLHNTLVKQNRVLQLSKLKKYILISHHVPNTDTKRKKKGIQINLEHEDKVLNNVSKYRHCLTYWLSKSFQEKCGIHVSHGRTVISGISECDMPGLYYFGQMS
jgi:hypothetical protein